MTTLVTLAEQILKHARSLESNLSSTSSTLPSLEATEPWTFPSPETSPTAYRTRTALLALLRDALALTLGPTEHLRTISNTQRMDFAVLQTVVYYGIHRHIPQHPDAVSFDDLAKKLSVNRDPLERILRHGFTIRLFREPVGRPGWVQHTPLSMAVEGLAPWLRLVGWEQVQRAFARIPEGIRLGEPLGSGAIDNGEESKSKTLENGPGEKTTTTDSMTPFELANGESFFSVVQSEPEPRQSGSQSNDSVSRPPGIRMPMSAFSESMRSHASVHSVSPYQQAASFIQGSDIFSSSSGILQRDDNSTTSHNNRNTNESILVDVGGGNGYVTFNIAEVLPSSSISKLLIQDLPSNQAPAQETSRLFPEDTQARVRYQVQDFFTPQPKDLQPKAYFMRSILHDWSDVDCARIVKNLLPAMRGPHGARLFVMDRVLPDVPGANLPQDYLLREEQGAPAGASDEDQLVLPVSTEAFQRYMDLLMFTLLGAKERSLRQWRELFRMVDEGLEVLRWEVPLGAETGVLEVGFRKE